MPIKISLKAARVNAGLTVLEAAKKVGIGKDKLIKLEANPGLVTAICQKQFAEAYGIPVECIFFGV